MRSYRRPGRYGTVGQGSGGRSGAGDNVTRGTGWTIFSYLISGMLAYGGIGWVIGHFTHIALLFPIGMLIGLAISVGWIIYRYGGAGLAGSERTRGQGPRGLREPRDDGNKEMMGDR
jgi:ATP synthase protein I